jgi:hypothetical protein
MIECKAVSRIFVVCNLRIASFSIAPYTAPLKLLPSQTERTEATVGCHYATFTGAELCCGEFKVLLVPVGCLIVGLEWI